MTKSYINIQKESEGLYQPWEQSLIAPRFTIKNFAEELHFYLRIYIKQKRSLTKIIIFLFLNAIQRILYTIGTFLIRIKKYY